MFAFPLNPVFKLLIREGKRSLTLIKVNGVMKVHKKIPIQLFIFILIISIIPSCSGSGYQFRSDYQTANALLYETHSLKTKPFLKAHLINGDVCILKDSWSFDTTTGRVLGTGTTYDFNRNQIREGAVSLLVDSVAIFETNKKIIGPEKNRVMALALMATAEVGMGIFCLTNPKACFGSCPTFYVNENESFHFADAEGFSNAISPKLEYGDIDAIHQRKVSDSVFTITMKNEALETHCVDDVKLLAWKTEPGERVYQTPSGVFYLSDQSYPLTSAQASEGDVTSLLKTEDTKERFSLANAENLNHREEIFMEYNVADLKADLGLVLSFRQTLMTTYFIYSAMGYMGDEAGDLFAKLERGELPSDQPGSGIKKQLGDIDIYTWNENSNEWDFQGGFYETGPIAFNSQLLPLKSKGNSSVKLKIILNQGLWRINSASLVSLVKTVKPAEVLPSGVSSKGIQNENALKSLLKQGDYLLSLPGNAVQISFTMKDRPGNYELFLYSKGYYLEWMRENWLKDKNMAKLRQLFFSPENYLKDEAGNYKVYETTMEETFWNSRIDTKTYTYYEN